MQGKTIRSYLNRSQMENYNISFAEIITSVSNNNQVVTAGEIQTGQGQFAVNVPDYSKQQEMYTSYPFAQPTTHC